jgi:transposase
LWHDEGCGKEAHMDIVERTLGDRSELLRRIGREKKAKQRDRWRAVLMALDGGDAPAIASRLGRSRRFVQAWAYAYRDGGIGAIGEKPRPGRPTTLPRDLQEQFKRRVLDGPTDADGGLCTLRGRDAQRILGVQYGVAYSLNGVYTLMARLGLACLKPRPRHRKNDPQAMAEWLERAPFLSGRSAGKSPGSASRSGSRTRPASASRAR